MNTLSNPRYLTKSRFKLAVECPTKLFYTGKRELYIDRNQEDDFLQALAEGGFQVGELAKIMFLGGIEVVASTHDEQLAETERLLAHDEVTIFEAAIRHRDLFARVDVLRKIGNRIELIEVKAKSFDSSTFNGFRGARGGIDAGMRPYLEDVAFQAHVLRLAHPELQVQSFLMLADKALHSSVDGLNQRFRIRRANGRPVVTVAPGTAAQTIGNPVLARVNVDELVDQILREPIKAPGTHAMLGDLAQNWAEKYRRDERIPPVIGPHCVRCEFRADALAGGQRSGFNECWRDAAGLSETDIAKGTVLDLWNFRGKKELIDEKIYLLADVPLTAFDGQPDSEGLSRRQRQAMQVSGRWAGRPEFFLDAALMRREMSTWAFPLHFIDFETARVAIPFFAGQQPYANIAFQFSHHVLEADERVEHRSEFLSTTPGRRPNYDFVRQLKVALGEVGTVFMWSPHENTTLNAILDELEQDPAPPPDATALAAFIGSLTTCKDGPQGIRQGRRSMVDMCRLAERAFFHPATKGSCSIKKVLPAVLRSSDYLKRRYSQPIYGAADGIRSLNFVDQVWWQQRDGVAVDPYKLLPPVFADLPTEALAAIESDDEMEIAQGGAATMAYARLQFDDLAQEERARIESALKRYCELDTLAMVMVYEAWREWLKS